MSQWAQMRSTLAAQFPWQQRGPRLASGTAQPAEPLQLSGSRAHVPFEGRGHCLPQWRHGATVTDTVLQIKTPQESLL